MQPKSNQISGKSYPSNYKKQVSAQTKVVKPGVTYGGKLTSSDPTKPKPYAQMSNPDKSKFDMNIDVANKAKQKELMDRENQMSKSKYNDNNTSAAGQNARNIQAEKSRKNLTKKDY